MAKQNIEAITRWQKENTDFVRFRARKTDHLMERAQMAVDAGLANSKQDFYIKAIKEKLERDGIPEIEQDKEAAPGDQPGVFACSYAS